MKGDDPFIDLRAVPPEILRPIQAWVDDYLTAPLSEHRLGFLGVTIRRDPRGPMVRHSELMAVYAKLTELSAASERALRQQAAEIEAECGLGVVKGHANNLKERLIRATEAQTVAELRFNTAQAEIASLRQQAAGLRAEKQGTDQRRMRALAQERDELVSQLQQTKADRDDRLQKMLAVGKRMAEGAKGFYADLHAAHERLKAENASLKAETAALAKRVAALLREAAVLKDETARLKAQTRATPGRAHVRV